MIIINFILAAKSTLAAQDCIHVQDGSKGIPCKSHQSLKGKSHTWISKLKKELNKDPPLRQYFAREPQASPCIQIPLLPNKLTRNLYRVCARSALGQAAQEASGSSEDTSKEFSFFRATSKRSIQILSLCFITLKCQSSSLLQMYSLVPVKGWQTCGISLSEGLNPFWLSALKSCCLNKRRKQKE